MTLTQPRPSTRATDYRFRTTWLISASCQEIDAILSNPMDLPRWWPEVYLAVSEWSPGDENGIGRVIDLHTKGFLPYTLRWSFRVIENRRPYGFSLEASGDFVGTGVWTFRRQGSQTEVIYDWSIRAEKPMLKRLSWLLKPVFAWNHRWAMRKGESALRREIERRRSLLY